MTRRPMSGLTEMMEYFTISEEAGGCLGTWPIYPIVKFSWKLRAGVTLNAYPATFVSLV